MEYKLRKDGSYAARPIQTVARGYKYNFVDGLLVGLSIGLMIAGTIISYWG